MHKHAPPAILATVQAASRWSKTEHSVVLLATRCVVVLNICGATSSPVSRDMALMGALEPLTYSGLTQPCHICAIRHMPCVYPLEPSHSLHTVSIASQQLTASCASERFQALILERFSASDSGCPRPQSRIRPSDRECLPGPLVRSRSGHGPPLVKRTPSQEAAGRDRPRPGNQPTVTSAPVHRILFPSRHSITTPQTLTGCTGSPSCCRSHMLVERIKCQSWPFSAAAE